MLYRLSPWHPLASYPGPLPCKLSKLYMAYISQGEKQHLYLYNLHKRYGDIIRIGRKLFISVYPRPWLIKRKGPNEVSIRSTDAIVPLLGPSGLPKGSCECLYSHLTKPTWMFIFDSLGWSFSRERSWSVFDLVAGQQGAYYASPSVEPCI